MRTLTIKRGGRDGFTLLELVTATALTASLAASSVVVVRTAHTAWSRHHLDQQVRVQAVAALQHIMRRVRQATVVTQISAANDDSGELALQNSNGSVAVWSHDELTNQVRYGVNGAADLLADGVTAMTLLGIRANGWQTTTSAELAHGVRCTLKYNVDRPSGPIEETVSCQAWLRSW